MKFGEATLKSIPRARWLVVPAGVLAIFFALGVALVGGFGAAADVVQALVAGMLHPIDGAVAFARFCDTARERPVEAFGAVLVCEVVLNALPLVGTNGGDIVVTLSGAREKPEASKTYETCAWISMLILLAIYGLCLYIAFQSLRV